MIKFFGRTAQCANRSPLRQAGSLSYIALQNLERYLKSHPINPGVQRDRGHRTEGTEDTEEGKGPESRDQIQLLFSRLNLHVLRAMSPLPLTYIIETLLAKTRERRRFGR